MIQVLRIGDPGEGEGDALLLSMGTDLEPLTPAESRFAIQAGEASRSRLRAMKDLPLGAAVVMPGGGLPVEVLIHVVIRSMDEGVSPRSVRRAFQNGLRQAAAWGVHRLVVLPLGVGAGNLDAEEAAQIMTEVFLQHREGDALPGTLVVLAADGYQEDAFRRVAP